MDSFEGREAASLLLPSPTILAIDLKKLTNIHLALLLIGSYRKNIGKKYEKTSENNFDCMADVFGLGLENKKVGHLVRLED
jgi:hypothetical protein